MVTKLKKISYHWTMKTIAFLLVVITFGFCVTMSASLLISTRGADELFQKDYLLSGSVEGEIRNIYYFTDSLFALKNENYIMNEFYKSEYDKQVAEKLKRLESAKKFLTAVNGIYYYVSDGENIFTNCDMTTVSEFKKFDLYNIVDRYNSESSMSFYVDSYIPSEGDLRVYIAVEEYAKTNADVMYENLTTLVSLKNEEQIISNTLKTRDKQIQNRMQEFTVSQNYLKNLEGIYYYATDGESIFANCDMTTADEFRNFNHYNIIDGYSRDLKIGYDTPTILTADTKIFIAFDNDFTLRKQAEFAQNKQMLQGGFSEVLVIFLLGILALIYLITVCGRNSNGEFSMLLIDRLWTDLTTIFIFVIICSYIAVIAEISRDIGSVVAELPTLCIIVSALFCSVGLMFLLSLVRHLKNKTLIKHSFIYIVCSKICSMVKRIFKTIFNITPLNIKIIGAVLIAELAAVFLTLIGMLMGGGVGFLFFLTLMIFVTTGIMYFILRFVIKPYDDEVKTRLELSLNREMKAERLKTELITNVSHDLKTPLTAIINYSDLLIKENNENEYAKVIFDKSQKLKTLTEDLFEVSKAQSGNISVNMDSLNVLELINQTLAEFDEHTVDFKINVPNTINISADSKLMNRAFENLIGNIIKYSLSNTRAYIEAYEKDKKTYITFKNIANYEMGFDGNEITERFSRGDTSRTTEGNGLGLAIAQSYTEACGGTLKTDIDGDLFKITLIF